VVAIELSCLSPPNRHMGRFRQVYIRPLTRRINDLADQRRPACVRARDPPKATNAAQSSHRAGVGSLAGERRDSLLGAASVGDRMRRGTWLDW